jgi:hypothetical protein
MIDNSICKHLNCSISKWKITQACQWHLSSPWSTRHSFSNLSQYGWRQPSACRSLDETEQHYREYPLDWNSDYRWTWAANLSCSSLSCPRIDPLN